MTTLELRNNFHHLIDKITNDQLLSKFYELMHRSQENTNGSLWNRLSKEEQDELLLSDLESDDPNNLITNSEIVNKHSKWL